MLVLLKMVVFGQRNLGCLEKKDLEKQISRSYLVYSQNTFKLSLKTLHDTRRFSLKTEAYIWDSQSFWTNLAFWQFLLSAYNVFIAWTTSKCKERCFEASLLLLLLFWMTSNYWSYHGMITPKYHHSSPKRSFPQKPTFGGDLQPLGARIFESYSFAPHLMSVIYIFSLWHGPKGQSATWTTIRTEWMLYFYGWFHLPPDGSIVSSGNAHT